MEYSQFAALFQKVKGRAMSPQEAASTLEKHLSLQPAARMPVPVQGRTYRFDDPYLRDHLVDGERVLIGVTYASLAIDHFFGARPDQQGVRLRGLEFVRPVVVRQDQPAHIQIDAASVGSGLAFKAICRNAVGAQGEVAANGKLEAAPFASRKVDISALKASMKEHGNVAEIYATDDVLYLGDSFKTVTKMYVSEKQILARVELRRETLEAEHSYLLHPLLISSAFLAVLPLVSQDGRKDMYLPFGIRDIRCGRPVNPTSCWLLISLVKKTDELVLFDFDLIDNDSNIVASFGACALKRRRNPVAKSDEAGKAAIPVGTAQVPAVSTPASQARSLYELIQEYVVASIANAAKIDSATLDIRRNVMDMGLESAQLVEVGAAIQKDMDIELYPTLFFEYTNVKELTDYFHGEHREKFSKLLGRANAATVSAADPEVPASPTPQAVKSPSNTVPVTEIVPVASKGMDPNEPIAIIGMHGQFAQAADLDQFWKNLCNETDVVREVPEDHWDYRPWFDENVDTSDKTYCKWGSFIDDVDKFDAPFFNISRREAEWIDPQIRLLLQSVYAAAEDAGYINRLRGTNTGVFVGACFHDYQNKIDELNLPVNPHLGINNTHTVMANRISYHFNLNGPSITVDTACSSSLFALHQACQALRNGECDLAFVCGANLLLSSIHYRVFSSLRALSPTGRCHSFDASADGYVPGECIASVLLKPLGQAIRDGDRIEAVIRGSAALHGGYTPSLTAPSVSGEQNVILKAWEDASVDPATITYIEAHGTGTKLGDPIEVNALRNAFARFTQKEQFCTVGSAKANIGHAEGAAGIAGILKVILQMKHRWIPPLMRFKKLNPYVALEKSALRIQHDGCAWDSPAGVPRRAGISSFGVAGAYAHVVLEEYLGDSNAAERSSNESGGPVLIVLSARNDKSLMEQARRLLDFVRQGKLADRDLANAAYTLQLGREAMEARLALQAVSIADLEAKLDAYLRGDKVTSVHYGQVKRNNGAQTEFAAQDLEATMNRWIQDGECDSLLEHWTKGGAVNWQTFYDGRRRFISLPTYAFARERYWIPESEIKNASRPQAISNDCLHPLLHQNTSDLSAQRYRTRLTGEEFFLADHVVRGEKILPGVAYLEMARTAVVHATGRTASEEAPIVLRNIVWMRPVAIGEEACDICIEFGSGSSEELPYEVYSPSEGGGRVVYSSGRACLGASVEPATLDLFALQGACRERTISSDECYRLISDMGLELGARLRGIESVHIGTDCLLAKLRLPDGLAETQAQFGLHPSVTDSALQACASMLLGAPGNSAKLALPYALESLEVLSPLVGQMWAYVRFGAGVQAASSVKNVDIDLCDVHGKVCARMRGLSFKLLADVQRSKDVALPASSVMPPAQEDQPRTLLALREWTEAAWSGSSDVPQYGVHEIVLCGFDDDVADRIVTTGGPERFVRLACRDMGIAEGFQHLAEQVLKEIQRIFSEASAAPALLQVVFQGGPQQRVFHALAALLKTAQIENSRFFGQVIETEAAPDAESLMARLRQNSKTFDQQISYRNGKRLVMASREMDMIVGEPAIPWKDDGVYLITGGAGELGLLFAREIARRVATPTLILTGRSTLDARRQGELAELRGLGATVDYCQVDVTDRSALARLLARIVAEHGELNGIVHSAGVLRDELIQRRNAGELAHVMAPKVQGLVNLDELTRTQPLDFFLMFSSIASVLGNAGQADYALGNAFMDAYAGYRAALAKAKLRSGRTLSVNWPLWKDGGMRPNEAIEKWFSQTFGLLPLESRAGIDALYRSWSANQTQVVVLAGIPDRIRNKVLPARVPSFARMTMQEPPATASVTVPQSPGADMSNSGELLDKMLSMLVQKAAGILKMQADEIDVRADLDAFGFNSVALTEFTNMLNKEFGIELTPTVFYERSTMVSFAEYLVEQHHAVFASKLLPRQSSPAPRIEVASNQTTSAASSLPRRSDSRFAHPAQAATGAVRAASTERDDAIAIIGISGRFPMAKNLDEFWSNLVAGRDCISEIPPDRWDWQAIWGDPQREQNKSNVKWGGFIDGIAEFDPLFFGISPREATILEPQQRLLLMCAWQAIEDSGYSAQSLSGSNTAVFVGTTATGYGELLNRNGVAVEAYFATSAVPSVGPNRLSYYLNFTGPSEPIETACSSALVAIHRGVQAIRNGSSDMALVGGVNTILSPELHMSFNKAGMLSEDGRCKTFSANANGFARGEGVGMILLKKLKAAEQDGDHIYGVIRSTAQNHGGRAKSLTAPNPKAQADLLRQAYSAAGIDPGTIGYIETHGTGTALGDPIEIDGLKSAFRQLWTASPDRHVPAGYCGLGSVKSNVGHLELAAGVAGVFKVLLQLKHKTLVKTLHCDEVNPYIQLKDSPFYIVQENRPWVAPRGADGMEQPRRAGVSSFSFGGANCHVVIEEYIDRRSGFETGAVNADGPAIVVLSARNEERLREHARQLLDFLNRSRPADRELGRIAYTLQTGRDAMEARLAVLAESVFDLQEKLAKYVDGIESEGVYCGQASRSNDMLALFAADDALQEAVGKWLQQRKFAKLMRLWVQGLAIDWNKLYGESRPLRMPLPTYPFAREQYWIPSGENQARQLAPQGGQQPETAKRYLEKVWQPDPETFASRDVGAGRKVAILANTETAGLANALNRLLPDSDVMDFSDVQVRLRSESWKRYDGCIDLLGCGYNANESMDQVKLLQAIIEQSGGQDVTLLYVTKGLEVYGNDQVNLSGASHVGLYRMLQSEYRHVRSRHMDAENHLSDDVLARQIASEYLIDSRVPEVCYRGGTRFVAGLAENNAWAGPGRKLTFDARHALWISGGTRGLGYLCAQHFVKHHGVKKLVLSGRDELPARDQWERYRNENSPIGDKIRSLLALEEQGAELLILAVPLADRLAVKACVERIKASFGEIGGVIHCAGTVSSENAAFIRKSEQEIRQVLDPKVTGLEALFDAVKQEPLQFFAMFSSVSAVIPSLAAGLSDYAMANAYMDYFAQAKYPAHPVVSVQWPRWNDSGMGAGGTAGKVYERTGLLSHSDADGLALLDSVLANRLGPVVMPATIDPVHWDPAKLMQAGMEVPKQAGGTIIPPSAAPRAAAKAAPSAGANDVLTTAVEHWLTGFFAEELRIPVHQLKIDVPFNEYGMESVMLAQVVSKMERKLANVKLDPSAVLENPTIRQLAAYLTTQYPDAFATLVQEVPVSAEKSVASTVERQEPVRKQAEEPVLPPQTADLVAKTDASVAAVDRVAIIGMSCHLPDAPDLASFWKNLMSKKDSIREVPKSRWDVNAHYSSAKVQAGKSISKWGAFLDNIEDFDPEYFKIPESLAVQMDPLERQWLEVSAEALADAGYGGKQLWGRKVGVFAGARTSNYGTKLAKMDKDVVIGLGQNFIAAHLAHIYNFKGPNFVVDAACASSLTAIHLAVQSIRNGESEVALAGGVEILLDESPYVVLSTAQVLSPDGRCKTFDESANGIGLGEGCAVIVLKPLYKAIEDGDKVYGVIDGSAINNDGNTMGVTTPNPSAQSELIQAAINAAGIDPSTISYVETHGTGTLIGDPIELNALTRIFTASTDRKQFCGVGSVKSNIGHLLSAAGAASIVKVLLSIVHRQLPPTIHCDNPNPRFNFSQSALYPVKNPTDWQGQGMVLRAGISSFGLGGNNAHVILSDEGIPDHLRATLEPKGRRIVFNRKRYWPEAEAPQVMEPEQVEPVANVWTEKLNQQRSAQDKELLDFFDVQLVSGDEGRSLRYGRSTA